MNHGLRSFHPAGRAPGRSDDLQIRISRERLLQERKNIRAIMVDGELLELGIFLSGGNVIVAVHVEREVAGAHGLAQNSEGDSLLRVEERVERFEALLWREFLVDEPGRGIGERSAEAVDDLVFRGFVDVDGEIGSAFGAELDGGLGGEPGCLIFERLNDLDWRGFLRRGSSEGNCDTRSAKRQRHASNEDFRFHMCLRKNASSTDSRWLAAQPLHPAAL